MVTKVMHACTRTHTHTQTYKHILIWTMFIAISAVCEFLDIHNIFLIELIEFTQETVTPQIKKMKVLIYEGN